MEDNSASLWSEMSGLSFYFFLVLLFASVPVHSFADAELPDGSGDCIQRQVAAAVAEAPPAFDGDRAAVMDAEELSERDEDSDESGRRDAFWLASEGLPVGVVEQRIGAGAWSLRLEDACLLRALRARAPPLGT